MDFFWLHFLIINLVSKYLLSTSKVPDIVIDTEGIKVDKTPSLALMEFKI